MSEQYADRSLTDDDIATMDQAARRFSGAYTGTSGSLAAYVLLLIRERRRLIAERDVATGILAELKGLAFGEPMPDEDD